MRIVSLCPSLTERVLVLARGPVGKNIFTTAGARYRAVTTGKITVAGPDAVFLSSEPFFFGRRGYRRSAPPWWTGRRDGWRGSDLADDRAFGGWAKRK
jgi:hypothetical protein